MTTDRDELTAARERLSALVDGELPGAAVLQACAQWREEGTSRATWHAYHLIGDVLRSDDLAGDPARDARFIATLRARLADEPVVLAPRPLEAPAASANESRRWPWMAPAAVAAGFLVVAGALVITRVSDTGADRVAPALAQAAASGAATAVAVALPQTQPEPTEPQTFVASGTLIRDARLDRYLAAHKQFAGSSALGVPSGFLRNATAESAGR
ncbi:MAG TPA: sigma-E factor negative regulatory protein [Burkholderiaceae bacterium]|nr:sigma-E factor negative regulatory protein [Burkholderiaceae bacterium]